MQSKHLNKVPTKLQMAWFAGLVDGEGCIHIAHRYRNGKPTPYYMPSLTICMTHLPTLQVISTLWGVGKVNLHSKYDKDNVNRKQRWDWNVSGPRCQEILTLIYPYLITKRADALIGITLQQRIQSTKPNRVYTIPDMELQRRKLLADLSKAVKKDTVLGQNIEREISKILNSNPHYQLRLNPLSAQADKALQVEE